MGCSTLLRVCQIVQERVISRGATVLCCAKLASCKLTSECDITSLSSSLQKKMRWGTERSFLYNRKGQKREWRVSGLCKEALRKHPHTVSHLEHKKSSWTLLEKQNVKGDKEVRRNKMGFPFCCWFIENLKCLKAACWFWLCFKVLAHPFGSSFLTHCSLSAPIFTPLSQMCGPIWPC